MDLFFFVAKWQKLCTPSSPKKKKPVSLFQNLIETKRCCFIYRKAYTTEPEKKNSKHKTNKLLPFFIFKSQQQTWPEGPLAPQDTSKRASSAFTSKMGLMMHGWGRRWEKLGVEKARSRAEGRAGVRGARVGAGVGKIWESRTRSGVLGGPKHAGGGGRGFEVWTQNLFLRSHGPRQGLYHWVITPWVKRIFDGPPLKQISIKRRSEGEGKGDPKKKGKTQQAKNIRKKATPNGHSLRVVIQRISILSVGFPFVPLVINMIT